MDFTLICQKRGLEETIGKQRVDVFVVNQRMAYDWRLAFAKRSVFLKTFALSPFADV